MTRRQLFRRRPLSLQAYIHRATVGLPKAERLDAAAELRTHLVERIDLLRAEGHPADEAEFLAVQAMGDPAPINRGLLGHAFTHRLGWLALGLVVVGGGGWYGYGYAQREWMPPREGVEYDTKLTLDDLQALNADKDAPRGEYQAMTLTYPKGTKMILYALYTPKNVEIVSKNLASEIETNLKSNSLKSIPGSYRYQERWLILDVKKLNNCIDRWSYFRNIRILGNFFFKNSSYSIPTVPQNCFGVQRQHEIQRLSPDGTGYRSFPALESTPGSHDILPIGAKGLSSNYSETPPLPLNEWYNLRSMVARPNDSRDGQLVETKKAHGMFIAVMPLDHLVGEDDFSVGRDKNWNITLIKARNIPLPGHFPRVSLKAGQLFE